MSPIRKFLIALAGTLTNLGYDLDTSKSLTHNEIIGLIIEGIATALVYAVSNNPAPPAR